MIRFLEYTDLCKEYFELLEQLSKTDYTNKIGVDQKFIDDMWNHYMDQPNKYILIYENRKLPECPLSIIGTASLIIERKMLHYGSRVARIEDVVVDKCGRGKNIGKRLLEKCVELSRNHKCYKITLECSDKNISFYEQLGFEKHENSMRLNL